VVTDSIVGPYVWKKTGWKEKTHLVCPTCSLMEISDDKNLYSIFSIYVSISLGLWRTITEEKAKEIKLLEEEEKNTRKCPKESKIEDFQQSIVATITPIVQRWDYLAPKECEANLMIFWSKFDPIVATMDLSWPLWRAESLLENWK
jgi:hypothetical protein